MVLSIALLALVTGYLYRSSPDPAGVRIGYIIEHGGWWGDLILISPVTAYILTHFRWEDRTITNALILAVAISTVLLAIWLKGSYRVWDVFHRNGEIKTAGWLHYGYMIAVLTALILFYFGGTKPSRQEANLITAAVAIHVVLGFLQPEWKTFGRVSPGTLLFAGAAWGTLTAGWWRLVH